MVRMVSDPDTGAYVERRTKEGKSKREIMRCLKRYVAREVTRSWPPRRRLDITRSIVTGRLSRHIEGSCAGRSSYLQRPFSNAAGMLPSGVSVPWER